MQHELTFTCDASFKDGWGGWAANLRGKRLTITGAGRCTSSTEAELKGCLMLLGYIYRNHKKYQRDGITNIKILSDCTVAIEVLKNQHTPQNLECLSTEVRRKLDSIPKSLTIQFEHRYGTSRTMRHVDWISKKVRAQKLSLVKK